MENFRSALSGVYMSTAILGAAISGLTASAVGSDLTAAIITVDPDAFSDGTDISNAFNGVTLSVIDGGGGPVFSRTDGAASTGSRTFGNSAASGAIPELIWFEGDGFNPNPPGPGPVLRVDFGVSTDFVAIDIINQDTFDGGVLRAFNAFDVEIATVLSIVTGQFGAAPAPQILSVSLGAADIAYVTVAGQSAQDSVHLDNLQFNQITTIPEPGVVALLGLGLMGMGFVRRRHAV